MFYSYQIDNLGFLFAIGKHHPNPPSQDDVVVGCTMFVTENYNSNLKPGMRLDLQSGGFYNLDQYGNNIPASFVPFEG
jgi:hypothetical protein